MYCSLRRVHSRETIWPRHAFYRYVNKTKTELCKSSSRYDRSRDESRPSTAGKSPKCACYFRKLYYERTRSLHHLAIQQIRPRWFFVKDKTSCSSTQIRARCAVTLDFSGQSFLLFRVKIISREISL